MTDNRSTFSYIIFPVLLKVSTKLVEACGAKHLRFLCFWHPRLFFFFHQLEKSVHVGASLLFTMSSQVLLGPGSKRTKLPGIAPWTFALKA